VKQIKIKHRESGDVINATLTSDGVILLPNGQIADCEFWSYDEPVDWIGGVIVMAVCTFAVFAMASAIVFFTATDERKFMRDCLQTASVGECRRV